MKEINNIKIKSVKDLRNLDLNELKKELLSSEKALFELKMKLDLNELKQTHFIKALRRYIASINTVIYSK